MTWRKWLSPGVGVPSWTLALTVALVWYALRYGSNAPVMDEWDVAPELRQFARDGRVGEWVLMRHNEHRYPAARLLYAAVMAATGYDFRAGMVASAMLLGAAAAVFARAAARARGRPAWGDLIVPALLLNFGASFNVLMGYQVAFSLFVLAAAAAAWVVVADLPGRRGDLAAGAALAGLAANGMPGLLLAGPLTVWAAWRAAFGPARGSWRGVVAAGLPLAAVAAYGLWAAAGTERSADPATRLPGWRDHATAAAQFLSMGLGNWVVESDWGTLGRLTVAGYAAAGLGLAAAIARRPADRAAALGLAAILLGVVGMACGVAWGRGCGLVERYTSPAAVGLVVAWLAAARWLPLPTLADGLAVVAAALLVWVNADSGQRFAQVHRMYYREFEDGVRAGLPPSFAADRFRGPLGNGDFRARVEAFRDLGFATFRDLPPEPAVVAVPVTPGGPPGFALPVLPGGRKVVGVRVTYETRRDVAWQQLTVAWTGPAGARSAAVYPHGRAGPQSSSFYVADAPTEARLEVADTGSGLAVTRVEWLVAAGE